MSMDSETLGTRRIPQQERGERSVADLLKAAAAEFAEVGYDAATMKAISRRAGASTGAVYQYFPNKEAIASALRTQYVNEIEQCWTKLEEATAGLSVKERTLRFVDMMIRFIEEHPACFKVLGAPAGSKRDKKTRDQLRERLASIFHTRRPAVSWEQAYRVASVVLQMIKGMNALYAEVKPQERLEIVKEYKLALVTYLEKRLSAKQE